MTAFNASPSFSAPSSKQTYAETRVKQYLTYGLAGAGVLAGGVAVLEGIRSKNLASNVNKHIAANGGVAVASDYADINSYHGMATTATVLYGVSAALIAGALTVHFAF